MNKKKAVRNAAIALGSTLALGAAALGAATVHIMKQQFPRGEYPDVRFSKFYRYDPDYKPTHSRVNVQFQSGENTLQGYIYGLENDDPKGLIVFAHGIYAGHESYINQLMWFCDNGWRVFTYDATGSCTSEGEGTVGLVQSAIDLDKALTFAESDERLNSLPVCLLGHSWGGYAVSAVQNFDHTVTACAEMSGYADPIEMLRLGSERAVGNGLATVFMPFAKTYNKAMFGEYATLNAVEGINKAGIPMLIIHGENDTFVDYKRVSILSKADEITDPYVRCITLTGEYADHNNFFSSDKANEYKKAFNAAHPELEGDTLTDDERAAVYDTVDKELLNDINTDLLEEIESFYLEALANK